MRCLPIASSLLDFFFFFLLLKHSTPHEFSNKYFQYMLNKKWQLKKWNGPAQFENADDGTLMMLPTDMVSLSVPDGVRSFD
eukprot:m.381018 g.381018  ORF g.381018 m.381018 type:complete len:81 (+) comp20965_c1_seq16:262-504(+)